MLITAIIGSYGKGNTYKAVQQMEKRLAEHCDVEFKYLHLSDSGLMDCKSCWACISVGEDKCPLNDGLADIEKQLMESDGVIFTSPNHACGTTALMRRFIERFAYVSHRPRFFGKYAVAVTTSGGPMGIKQTLLDLSYFSGGGFTMAGKLGLMTPPVAATPEAARKMEQKINACADRLYRKIKEHRMPRATYAGIMQFAAFRGMYVHNPVLGEKKFPADMAYWREHGWLDKKARYFYKTGMSIDKRIFGWIMEKVISLVARSMQPSGGKASLMSVAGK